jgi:NAD(P)H-dependent FMN reductase
VATSKSRLAVITASVRSGRIGPRIANWFSNLAETEGNFEVDRLDLADFDVDDRTINVEQVLHDRLDQADAFVIVTPEYNHGYPATFKAVIDATSSEWHAKPVGFVSYGGISGGIRAVEQLRLVFAEMHATTVRSSVILPNVFGQVAGNDFEPFDSNVSAAKTMLVQLDWWTTALKNARLAAPYTS